ncbi:MAG: exodeoxyribonuclease VII large subunit [Clostridia bacterium]
MEKIYSVSQLNRYVKMIFDRDAFLGNVNIRGEITNFKAHYTGHFYFTLKDDTSTVKCVMFKGNASLVKFKPTDGMKVVISGQVNVFERDGVYQIYCKEMTPEGLGELYLAYEQLKQKLSNEGLFRPEVKKSIPYLPRRVGVITSRTGAVVKDIINVSTRRFPKADLLIYPAAVQGVNVSSTVIAGLDLFNNRDDIDVIIIARGGGSFEDLFGFNDETLARKIFESKIPIISAVGHETDFTICDFVADLRAPTPSAAAELVYPKYSDLVNKILIDKNRLINATSNFVQRKKDYIIAIKATKLEKGPLDEINRYRMTIDNMINNSYNKISLKQEKYKANSMQAIAKLDALSPLKTLTRGYCVVNCKASGKLLKSVKDVKKLDNLEITLLDGKIHTVVE